MWAHVTWQWRSMVDKLSSKQKVLYIHSCCYRCKPNCLNTLGSGRNGHHFADDIFKFTFLDFFLVLSITLQNDDITLVTISRHCFRWWLGDGQAPSHFWNQWKPYSLTRRSYSSAGSNEQSTVYQLVSIDTFNLRVECHQYRGFFTPGIRNVTPAYL